MNSRELSDYLVDCIVEQSQEWILFGNAHMDANLLTIKDLSLINACVYIYQPTTLGLANIGITDDQLDFLMRELKNNTSIRCLYLPFNQISNVGALALAELLMHNKTIEKLILFANNISDIGIHALANALIANTTLRKLELFNNAFSSEVVDSFAQALRSNHELEKLVLFAPLGEKKLPDALNKKLHQNKRHHQSNWEKFMNLSIFAKKKARKSDLVALPRP